MHEAFVEALRNYSSSNRFSFMDRMIHSGSDELRFCICCDQWRVFDDCRLDLTVMVEKLRTAGYRMESVRGLKPDEVFICDNITPDYQPFEITGKHGNKIALVFKKGT